MLDRLSYVLRLRDPLRRHHPYRISWRAVIGLGKLALLASMMSAAASAQTSGVWKVTGNNLNWSDPANWQSSVASGIGVTADFSQVNIPGARNVVLDGPFTVGTLIFGDSDDTHAWTLNGASTLTLETAAGIPEIRVVNRTLTVNATLGGIQGFRKTGAGTLALANAGITLTGGIALNEGVLSFTNGALGTNAVTFGGNATLTWGASTNQDISSQIVLGDGFTATLNTSTNNVTLASVLQTGVSGNAAVTKTGGGTLTLTAANTWTGLTRVNVGRLVLAGGNNRLAATSGVTIGQAGNSGVLQLGDASGAVNQTVISLASAGTGTANAVVGGNAAVSTLTVNVAGPASNSFTFAGLLGGAGANENNLALTKAGAGTLVINNAANTFTGGVNIQGGTLEFGLGALAANTVTFTGNGTLTWNGTNTQDVSSQIRLNNGVTASISANGNTVTLATAFQVGTNNSVTKSGGGTFIITAANTWTNGTRINNGRMILTGGDNRLSDLGGISLGNGANSGVLQLGDASGASNQTITNLTIIGNGTANAIVGGNSNISTLTLNTDGIVAYAGLLGGIGANENQLALVKGGTGIFVLNGENTFAGDVTINGGSLLISKSAALGLGNKTVHIHAAANAPSLQLDGTNGDIVLASGIRYVTSNDDATNAAIVSKAGNNVISGSIAPTTGGAGTGATRIKVETGTLTLEGDIAPELDVAAASTVILDGDGNGTVSGLIANHGAHTLGIRKEGAGTWSLLAANTYSGPTDVAGGRLNLTTAQSGGGAVTVRDGATLGLKLAASGQTLATSELTLGELSGSTLSFDLGAFANPSIALITAPTFITHGLNVLHVSGTGLNVGQFALIDYTGSIGGDGFSALSLGILPARVTANLLNDTTNTQVLLNITAFDVPKWIGGVNNQWDIDDGTGTGTLNWREVNSGLATRYLQGSGGTDSVLFDDTVGVPLTVDLTTTLTPATVTVNTSINAFVFEGAGKLSGSTQLIKNGSSKLIFKELGLNDYIGATTINGGTLQIGDGVTSFAGGLGTGDVSINNSATLILKRPDDITVANVISGSAASTIIQEGPGSVTLSGNNASFEGSISVAGGTLVVGGANALGSLTGGTSIATGATLDVGGFSLAENISNAGGTLRNTVGTTGILSGNISLDGGGTVHVDDSTVRLTITTAITGTGGLKKSGAGTLVLTGNNTYAGGTTISGGILQIGATGGAGTSGALPAGDIDFAADEFSSATLTILRSDAITIANNITSSGLGTNAIIIGVNGAASPSGTVTFSGNNSFTGNVTINGGTLKITNSNALGSGTKTVRVASNALPSLVLDGSAGDITLAAGINYQVSSDGSGSTAGGIVSIAGNNTVNGVVSMINGGGGNARISVQAGSTLTLAGGVDANGATGNRTLLIGGAGTGHITGVISDTGANVVTVTKDGDGTWSLENHNTFTGVVNVNAGTLQFNNAAATGAAQSLGQGTGVVNIGTATTTGTLEYIGLVDALLGRGITVGGVAGGVVKNSSNSGVLTLAGTVTKNGRPLTLTGGRINVTGLVTGATLSDLIVDASVVTLSNTANNYNGTTHVRGGGTLKNGASEVLTDSTVVQLGEATTNTSGTYDLNGFHETISGLTGVGTGARVVTNNGATDSTLTVSGASTFNGVIQDGATAKVNLAKSTGGVFTLTGDNTYTGTTTISGGALQVGAGGTGASQVEAITLGTTGSGQTTVSGTGILAGTGFVRGGLTIAGGSVHAGDTIATAGDQLGTLWIGGNVTFESGSLVLQISSSDLNVAALADSNSAGYSTALLGLTTESAAALASTISIGAHDHLEISGTIDWAATGTRTVSIELASTTDILAGDVFNLLDWSAALNAGTFNAGGALRAGGEVGADLLLPTLANGLGWDTSLFAEHGILVVTQLSVVPEPSRMMLMLFAFGAVILRRKRGGRATAF
ncbi:putative secreted protein with PEP-CTERM sorting signal [Roseimicrobium gellanilyticum]|uniref:Putative secreted protein with PEP-CTERM sorting signal n=1 Tax=Roseimicrobium gellanilyticum TaxID=748857 RepID=A0A366HIJ0_9BACT|nr:autotransporter-associated beta strand repeat-containing protein [Roseimicrobium gellanilyticum]RBP41419.1 putative secreted protein with PEP-CTERM sorting signal [Roseimicrobium gellanilyticum]